MSRKTKRIEKLMRRPRTMKYSDLVAALCSLGFVIDDEGKHPKAYHQETGAIIICAEPHPGNDCKTYFINQVVDTIEEHGIYKIKES